MDNLKTSPSWLQLLYSCVQKNDTKNRPRCAWCVLGGRYVTVTDGDSEEVNEVEWGICPTCRAAMGNSNKARMRLELEDILMEGRQNDDRLGTISIARKVQRGQNVRIEPEP